MALLGYAKAHPAFSIKQQVAELKSAGCDRIFQDKVNEYTGLHKLIEAYEEGRDLFVTPLHRKNSVIQEQFLAMLELKKYERGRGRPKKSTVNIDEVVIKLLQEKTPPEKICKILDISSSTLSRIKNSYIMS